jgi:hypothetical protein
VVNEPLYVQIGLFQIPLTSRVVQFSLIARFLDTHGGSGRRTRTNKEQDNRMPMMTRPCLTSLTMSE